MRLSFVCSCLLVETIANKTTSRQQLNINGRQAAIVLIEALNWTIDRSFAVDSESFFNWKTPRWQAQFIQVAGRSKESGSMEIDGKKRLYNWKTISKRWCFQACSWRLEKPLADIGRSQKWISPLFFSQFQRQIATSNEWKQIYVKSELWYVYIRFSCFHWLVARPREANKQENAKCNHTDAASY